MYMANAHALAITMSFGALDAYRHALDLHFNMVLTGSHSTGKSFTVDLQRFLRITGTVTLSGAQTSKAAYTDSYHNDEIWVCHEIRPDMFRGKEKGGDDTAEAEYKEYLTSMKRVLQSFVKDKSGRRTHRMVYSEQIGCTFGCSNIDSGKFSGAMRSRFSAFNFLEYWRTDRHAADLIGVEKQLTPAGIARRDEFQDEMCTEQFLHYNIEKLIACRALSDVTTKALDLIRHTFHRRMRDEHMSPVESRCQERMTMLDRKLVITRAIELLYSSPHSKYWKKPFSIYQLMDIDCLLHDDEEIAHMAIDMVRHEMVPGTRLLFIKTVHAHVIDLGRRRILQDPSTVDLDEPLQRLYLTRNTEVATTSSMIVRRRPSGAASAGQSSYGGMGRLGSSSTSMRSTNSYSDALASDVFPPEYMNCYAKIEGSPSSIARNVADWTKNTNTVMTEEQGRVDMHGLTRMSIKTQRRRWSVATHQPERIPGTADVPEEEITMPAAIQTPHALFLHLDLMTNEDPIEECIRYCLSSLLPGPRRYVTGQSLSTQEPYKFRVREVHPDIGREHFVIDYAKEVTPAMRMAFPDIDHTDGTGIVHSGPQRLQLHYDDLSRRARAELLMLDPDTDGSDRGVCSFLPYEEYAATPVPPGHELYGKRRLLYTQDLYGQYPATLSCDPPPSRRKRKTLE